MQFTLSNKAKDDLHQISIFSKIRLDNKESISLIKQFDDTFHLLADIPLAGTVCDQLKQGCLKYALCNHIIFYQQGEANKVDILRILHKSFVPPSPFEP